MSYTNTSPASTFGGQWSSITGRFLYANASTSTGGENAHTLSVNEMPSHSHTVSWYTANGSGLIGWSTGGSLFNMDGLWNGGGGGGVRANPTGVGGSHNNMPQYQSCYCWRRTS